MGDLRGFFASFSDEKLLRKEKSCKRADMFFAAKIQSGEKQEVNGLEEAD